MSRIERSQEAILLEYFFNTGSDMPERNLVSKLLKRQICVLAIVSLMVGSTQIGCSKLRQSTFNRDLLGNKDPQPQWATDYSDSASRYTSESQARVTKDSARILDPIDESNLKLVATPAPPINAANSDASDDAQCDHQGAQCDCHKPKMKPVLPYAEPIEPPVSDWAPPTGLVSQPLAPILFNRETRVVQTDLVKEIEKENSLRRNDQWSHEQVAAVTTKPDSKDITASSIERTAVASDAEIEISVDQLASAKLENELEKNRWRDLEQTEIASNDSSMSYCPTCNGLNCNGTCDSQNRRAMSRELQPVVNSEPIVIVATTSSTTIPPFAEHPADTEILIDSREFDVNILETDSDFVAELEVDNSIETATLPQITIVGTEAELPVNSNESFDDLSDEEWIAMFGPAVSAPVDVMACPVCHSVECSDPNCGQVVMEKVVEAIPVETNDFQFPTNQPNEFPTDIAHADSTPTSSGQMDTSNDFLPVTHLADVSNSNDFSPMDSVATETPAIETSDTSEIATEDAKQTIELPMLESQVIHVPDGGPTPLIRRSQQYTGPAVRFEVIDATVPWSEKLNETIQNVQSRLSIESEPEAKNGLEVNLRLLEVLKRQMIDVEDRKDALTNEEKQYWHHQLDAIAMMLNSDDQGTDLERHNTAINTLEHLRKAVERLESIADLTVSNGEFCTEVSGFGQFKTFPTTTFQASQRMLVYCEVENYSSVQRQVNAQAHVATRLRGSFAIYDQQGRAVQQSEYPIVDDVARKRRRDFYMHFPIQLNNLPAGKYKLELLVEDLNGNKSAGLEPGLEFQVK